MQSPAVLRRIVLSFDALAADVYWIRALQHYGGDRLSRDGRQRQYWLLYPMLDLTTSLDPHFTIAHTVGAIFLSEGYPGGPGRPDLAVALLNKGIAAQPDNWRYYHDIAFVLLAVPRHEDGRRLVPAGAEAAGAPGWLEPVAASLLIEGGDRQSARFILQQILNSPEAWLQQMARRALLQIDALDILDRWVRPRSPGIRRHRARRIHGSG